MTTTPPNNEHDWHRLFAAKADATITPEEHEALCALLRTSVEARRQWFAFQDAEAGILGWAQRETVRRGEGLDITAVRAARPAGDRRQEPNAMRPWRQFSQIAAAVAATAVIAGILVAFWPGASQSPNLSTSASSPREEATTSSVAMLSRGVNAEWDRTLAAPAVNAPLAPGLLRLKSGVVEIEFFQGARLCVEGPAEIQLVSAGEAFCRYGRFSAHVPPQARGFRIGTPKGDIVDLGTDFGLDLNAPSPELHVFKGEVELHQPSMQVRKLTTGNAMDLSQPAQLMAANADAFAFSRNLTERVTISRREAFTRWQEAGSRWNDAPDLRLRFDFQDQENTGSLRNVAAHGDDVAAGTIVGCNWTEGRWPGKSALQFRSVSDRVRINVPGEYAQLTLAAWVQLHSLGSRQAQSSLCMSQGIEAGGIHWQILHDGSICLGLGISARPKIVDDYISPIVFTPERFGQWTHLAAVLDGASQEVRFYVNGQRLSTHPLKRTANARPAIAELGNWNPSSDYRGAHPVRNFVGCMDEFSLSARALTDSAIRQLAEGMIP